MPHEHNELVNQTAEHQLHHVIFTCPTSKATAIACDGVTAIGMAAVTEFTTVQAVSPILKRGWRMEDRKAS